MCARDPEVVSVPGPRFSLASESAVLGGSPDLTNVRIRFGNGDSVGFSILRVSFQASYAH